jgi:ATP-binding cassette subfamily F protein 3
MEPRVLSGKWVLEAEHLKIGYDEPLLELSLRIRRGQKIGIIGDNGVGKSTFLKTVAGLLAPLEGKCTLGNRTEIGYFDQQSAAISSEKQVAEHFHDLFPALTEKEVRQTLGAYLFGGKAASRRVCDLSGGEKARLVLAELLYSRPNLLILDEPTNHMDIRARETIESALSTYRGTLLFVSHDRYFIRQAADAILVFEGDQVMYYPFGYEHYLERKKQKGEDLSALIRAEDQALISGLRAVPKAERHRLREMDTEDAYFDWQLRLAGEQMEEARMKVELLWEKYCEQEINAWQDDSWILLEERKKQLDEAWENWTQTCLSWMEIWESMGENSPENI